MEAGSASLRCLYLFGYVAFDVFQVPLGPAISWVAIEEWILGNKILGINRVIGRIAGQVYHLSNPTSFVSFLCFSIFDDKTIHPLLDFESDDW